MDRQTLRTTVRKILFDQAAPTSSRWSDDDLNRFLNEGLLEVSRAAKRRKTAALSFTAGESSKTLPTDLLRIDGNPLWQATGESIRREIVSSADVYPLDDVTGRPREYWLIGNTIIIRPVPDVAGTLTVVYLYKFPELATDTDVPEPENVDGILIAYALWQALDFDGSPLAQVWREKFVQQLAAWEGAENKRYYRKETIRKVFRWY